MKFSGKVKIDTKTLKKLQAELDNGKGAMVKVGILQNKLARDDGGEFNNADIGAVHELGSKEDSIPRRSFLEVPITEHMPAKIKKVNKKKLINVIIKDGLGHALKMLGVIGETVVDEAFETRGNGTWPPLSKVTLKRRKHGGDMPLIDTGKLRRSITSKVYLKEKGA